MSRPREVSTNPTCAPAIRVPPESRPNTKLVLVRPEGVVIFAPVTSACTSKHVMKKDGRKTMTCEPCVSSASTL
jgi:hypothetical protein